jgi:hypothetical protein
LSPSDSPEKLGRHRLRAHYARYRQNRFFAADGLLNQLGADAWSVAREEVGDQGLIATALATIFCDAARLMEGIPITADAGERWFGLMDGPIVRCLDILVDGSTGPSATAVAEAQAAYGIVHTELASTKD